MKITKVEQYDAINNLIRLLELLNLQELEDANAILAEDHAPDWARCGDCEEIGQDCHCNDDYPNYDFDEDGRCYCNDPDGKCYC